MGTIARVCANSLGWVIPCALLLITSCVIYVSTGEAPWWHPLGAFTLGWCACLLLFVGGLWILQRLLRYFGTPFAVAQVTLEEALRRRVAWGTAAVLWSVILGLPYWLGDSRLDYRLQSYLSYSLGFSTLLLSVVTVLLGCSSIANEVEDRRIYTAMVKPVRRSSYVLGKVLGIVLLNGVMLMVVAAAIAATTQLQLAAAERRGQGHDSRFGREGVGREELGPQEDDRVALERARREVLVGRRALMPQPPIGYIERRTAASLQRLKSQGVAIHEDEVRANEEKAWRYLAPGSSSQFVFDLSELPFRLGEYPANLRLKARAPFFSPEKSFPMRIEYRGASQPDWEGWVQSGESIVLALEATHQPQEAGGQSHLEIIVHNASEAGGPSLLLSKGGGIELLYVEASFGNNLLRGMLVSWLKLTFLATLGVFASTFLGFPVACLFALILTLCASLSDYIVVSYVPSSRSARAASGHSHHHQPDPNEIDWLGALETVGVNLARTLRPFTEVPVVERLVEGRVLLWNEVARSFVWIAVGWGGVTIALGATVFRRRELARVQV